MEMADDRDSNPLAALTLRASVAMRACFEGEGA